MAYVSLHNHTTFSIMDALSKPIDLFKRAKELGQPAIAVTDHGSMAGMWDCLKASRETGVKLIAGCEFYFVDNLNDLDARFRHVILLAKNAEGYKNLLTLNAIGFDNSIITFKKVYPRIDWKLLEKYKDGLICTTACGNGILGQLINAKNKDAGRDQAKRLKDIFGDSFAIEIQPNALTRNENLYAFGLDQRYTNIQLVKIAKELDIKVVISTNSHYINKDQADAHDALLAIGSGQPIYSNSRLKYSVSDFYVKSEEEIREFFLRDKFNFNESLINEMIENTIYFSEMCETPDWIDPKFSNPTGKELPAFPVKDEKNYIDFNNWRNGEGAYTLNMPEDCAYLRYWVECGFKEKVPSGMEEEYRKRLNEEFEVIEYHGFSSYMLIVADYIRYCQLNDIRVGAGRGSVGGSLIAYLIDIHKADPIKYKLIFARFHNKEKTSFPDIDSDFAPSGRDKVQQYIRQKYGDAYVAHVSNVNTITPKVYARDISRAFEFGDDRKKAVIIGNAIADSIPKEIKTVKSALESAPLFVEWSKKFPQLEKFATTIGGKSRAWATHAAGLVIGSRPLIGLIPIRKDQNGDVAIEYEKERAEENGLVKMDTLGLETLDIISQTYDLIKEAGKSLPPDPIDYSSYDEKAYDLISNGDTLCVFQFGGSSGTADLCKKLKPKSMEELAAINTLARPAAKEIREPYIKAKNGELNIKLMHPSLNDAFKDTHGFGIYEECLLYLARDVAGWNLHSADRLRKLTKEKGKNPEKVAKWREEFIEDAFNNKQIPKDIATKIWDDVVAKFGGYAFNKSHALLYSFVGYHTAYLKAHYPIEFLTANLMSEVKSNAAAAKDNIARIKEELRRKKVKIIPPDLNNSGLTYKIVNDNTLMTGLDSLKFIGKDAIPEIIKKRPFTNFEDFLTRCDARKVKAPAVQALAASGCLDCFGLPRKLMYLYASDYRKKLQVWLKKSPEKRGEFKYPWPTDVQEWSIGEKFSLEEFYLGEGISGSIYDRFPGFFPNNSINFKGLAKYYPEPKTEKEKKDQAKNKIKVTELRGEIRDIFKFVVKKEGSKIIGQTMARVLIHDPEGNDLTIIIFPELLKELPDRITRIIGKKIDISPGMAIKFNGYISWYEGELSIIFDNLADIRTPPSLPEDLKAKKVTMPKTKKEKANNSKKINKEELLDEIEDDLINEGIIDEDDEEFEESEDNNY